MVSLRSSVQGTVLEMWGDLFKSQSMTEENLPVLSPRRQCMKIELM